MKNWPNVIFISFPDKYRCDKQVNDEIYVFTIAEFLFLMLAYTNVSSTFLAFTSRSCRKIRLVLKSQRRYCLNQVHASQCKSNPIMAYECNYQMNSFKTPNTHAHKKLNSNFQISLNLFYAISLN